MVLLYRAAPSPLGAQARSCAVREPTRHARGQIVTALTAFVNESAGSRHDATDVGKRLR